MFERRFMAMAVALATSYGSSPGRKGRKSTSRQSSAQQLRHAPPIGAMPKLGRNELCLCGSGRKFKKCCLR
jgi:uncharacterized protein YecA (UPF0149 family)